MGICLDTGKKKICTYLRRNLLPASLWPPKNVAPDDVDVVVYVTSDLKFV